jgi:hypothetical protein
LLEDQVLMPVADAHNLITRSAVNERKQSSHQIGTLEFRQRRRGVENHPIARPVTGRCLGQVDLALVASEPKSIGRRICIISRLSLPQPHPNSPPFSGIARVFRRGGFGVRSGGPPFAVLAVSSPSSISRRMASFLDCAR